MITKDIRSMKLLIIAIAPALFASSCVNSSTAEDQASLKTAETTNGYPVAKPMLNPDTGKPVADHYISPFRPYNPIVAKSFKSGQLAGDPSTIKLDSKTGKPDQSTMKVFRIP